MTRLIYFILCGFLISGCEKPQVTSLGTPATAGGVTLTVGEYDIRIMELHEGDETFGYPLPMLVIPVTIKNEGPDAFTYVPSHQTQQMSEATTPLLYADPGPEAELPPESKVPINGVFLERGAPNDQVKTATAIPAGESITDLFLFEVPPESTTSLIFSLPPVMHRGKLPVLVRVPYEAKAPTGPKIHEMGAPIAFDGISLTIKSAKLEYVKTKDNQGDGYSSEPLLRIAYTIENKSEEEVLYDPAHRALNSPGAKLHGRKEYNRVRFPANVEVLGQVEGQVKLEPGGNAEDTVLFEVTVEFPASQFGRSGLARVSISFDPKKPDKPAELSKKDPAPQKSDDG